MGHPLSQHPQTQPFPLTEVQQAYWVGRSSAVPLGGVSTHYYYEIEAHHLDLFRLEAALNALVMRHAMLRAVILPDGTQQVLEETPRYEIAKIDLTAEKKEAIDATILRLQKEMSHQVLPSDRWPLFDIRACLISKEKTVLFLSFDALVLDERSRNAFFLEWKQLYCDPDIVLPSPQFSFRDFVLAEQSHRKSKEYLAAKQYWGEQISSLPPAPELPLTKNLEDIFDSQFSHLQETLDEAAWSGFKKKAEARGLRPTSVLLSAFADVLRLWSKRSSFTVNLTLFNKLAQDDRYRDVLGDYTSSLLVPIENLNPETFEARTSEIAKRLRRNLRHSSFSGVSVIREILQREGDKIRPVMPVVFTSLVSTDPRHRQEDPLGWMGETIFSMTQTPQVTLDNQVRERQGALQVAWDFVEDVFPEGMIQDLFQAYMRHIDRLATSDAAWNESFPDLAREITPASHRRLTETTNATTVSRRPKALHEPFLEKAAQDPNRSAILSLDRSLNYGELKAEAELVADQLIDNGAKSGSIVAIVMEKGWEQIVGVLGVLISGAAYLPLDPILPRERLWFLLEDAQVDLIVTQPCIEEIVEWPDGPQRMSVRRPAPTKDAPPVPKQELVPKPAPDPRDLAYVIYTSGSTGKPKGVMIAHAAAYNTIVDINQRFSVTPDDRVFALSSLSFDLSVYDIFGTLAAGAAIVLPDPGGVGDPAHWSDALRKYGVTIWNSVPALVELLIDYAEDTGCGALSTVRLALMSGDWIPVSLPDRIKAANPGIRIVSLGGATEVSIWSIYFEIDSVKPGWKSIPYGKPLANQSVWVLNDDMEPCPVWAIGEICIGGAGLAQGYWRDETQTAKAFRPHPRTGGRIYRTGDLGRLLPGGDIEILGREDLQVKIHGYRIELKEIEAALSDHPLVSDAVVKADRSTDSDRLVAYVVPKRADRITANTPDFDHAELRLTRPGLRETDGQGETIGLTRPDRQNVLDEYRQAATCRAFSNEPVALNELEKFLHCMAAVDDWHYPFPRFLYPSAGGLYAVQVYIEVREGRVDGLERGTYYYDPYKHELVRLRNDDLTAPTGHVERNNPIVEASAFAIFLAGRMSVVESVYPGCSEKFCLLEAGHIAQLLMTAAQESGLGLCPIGQADYAGAEAALGLGPPDKVVYSFVGARRLEPPSPLEGSHGHGLPDVLREFLRQKLPPYMVPSFFMVLERLSLNENGKIDRGALPSPDISSEPPDQTVTMDDSTPESIKKLVRDVIGADVPDHDVNLLHLGATSLDLIRIVNAMERRFGVRPLSQEFFREPMLSSLTATLTGRHEPSVRTSVPLQKEGDQLPLFCVHDNTGHILSLRVLARQFAPRRPVYGLEYREALAVPDVETLAGIYVDEIRDLRPGGPYALVGFSFGAAVAFEMARQLRTAGQEVALLALVDGGPRGYPPTGLRAVKSKVVDFFAQPVATWPEFLRSRIVRKARSCVQQALRRVGLRPPPPPLQIGPDTVEGFPSNPHLIRLHGNYIPEIYEGRLDVFRCVGDSRYWRLMPDLGWAQLAKNGFNIHEMPGKHGSVMAEPNAGILAARINKILALADN